MSQVIRSSESESVIIRIGICAEPPILEDPDAADDASTSNSTDDMHRTDSVVEEATWRYDVFHQGSHHENYRTLLFLHFFIAVGMAERQISISNEIPPGSKNDEYWLQYLSTVFDCSCLRLDLW